MCVPVKWLGILLDGFGGKAGGCFSANGLLRGTSMPSLGSGMPFAGGVAGVGFGVWPARHITVSPGNCDNSGSAPLKTKTIAGGGNSRYIHTLHYTIVLSWLIKREFNNIYCLYSTCSFSVRFLFLSYRTHNRLRHAHVLTLTRC